MNTDPFEEKLSVQPFRQIPAEWRRELLAKARGASRHAGEGTGVVLAESRGLAALPSRLLNLLWPSPQAWGGLAAIWLVLLALHFSERAQRSPLAGRQAPAAWAIATALKEQERVLAELTSPPQPPPLPAAPQDPVVPGPRSQAPRKFFPA